MTDKTQNYRESQSHGLLFEDAVISAITGLSKTEYAKMLPNSYTNALDIVKDCFSDLDRSIKVTGSGGVGCGDILRFLRHCRDNDLVMIVGVWKQVTSNIKMYEEIYEFELSPDHYTILFGGITEEVITPFVNYVKSIPYGKESQLANRKVWKEKRKTLYDQYGRGLMTIDAKIDSQRQRRVQCSVNIKDMINSGIPFTKYTIDYKGISLPYEQESTSRTFSRT